MSKYTIEEINGVLGLLRKTFEEMNKEIIERVDGYLKTGHIKITVGSYDYIQAIKFLKEKQFGSLEVLQLFEYLLLYHFFKFCCSYSMNPEDYIQDGDLNQEKFIQEAMENTNVLKARGILYKELTRKLSHISIKKSAIENDERTMELIKTVLCAKNRSLEHVGDHDFIVSMIPVHGSGFKNGSSLKLNDNIFYTYDPKQIIAMAHEAKPGIYIIANVPQDKLVEVSFYILFITEGDAYLIDHGKHSYRVQFYRTSSRGESGENRWLGRKYEYTYLPIDEVATFFEKSSADKAVTLHEGTFSFRVIASLANCAPEVILWTRVFIDECIHRFIHTDILKEITPAVSAEFVQIEGSAKPDQSNLPAVYKESLPVIKSLDWSTTKTSTEDTAPAHALEPFIRSLPASVIKLESPQLTSFKQVEAALIYEKRRREAANLQKQLDDGYEKNNEEVFQRVRDFVETRMVSRGDYYFLKALQNKSYSTREYSKFCQGVKKEGAVRKYQILYTLLKSERIHTPQIHMYGGYRKYSNDTIYIDPNNRCWPAGKYRGKPYCVLCDFHSSYENILHFTDILQFKEFFEVTDEELKNLPSELSFLNPARSQYTGNSILDDVDPVALIRNPWWAIDRSGSESEIQVKFLLCKRCQKRLGGAIAKQDSGQS